MLEADLDLEARLIAESDDEHGDPAVEPPPPAKGSRPIPGQPRDRATARIVLENGSILAFYERYGRWQATCKHESHGECKFTQGTTKTCLGKGRPVGLMVAWLEVHGEMSSEEHLSPFTIYAITQEVKEAARRRVLGMAGGPELLSHERELDPGEREEPEF